MCDYVIFARKSNKKSHKLLLEQLKVIQIVSLYLRVGESSGAILYYPLIQSAAVFLNNMASCDYLNVIDGEDISSSLAGL